MSKLINIIWIDQNVNSKSFDLYAKDLEAIPSSKLKLLKNTDEAITYLKEIKFEETFVITSGRLYTEFVEKFKENINDMKVIPKIIVFTRNKDSFLGFNPEYNSEKNKFYSFGGIAIWFKEVKSFLDKEYLSKLKDSNKSESKTNSRPANYILSESEIQLTFEYIDSKEKLLLPFKKII